MLESPQPRVVEMSEEECDDHEVFEWNDVLEECVDPTVCEV